MLERVLDIRTKISTREPVYPKLHDIPRLQTSGKASLPETRQSSSGKIQQQFIANEVVHEACGKQTMLTVSKPYIVLTAALP